MKIMGIYAFTIKVFLFIKVLLANNNRLLAEI